MGKSFHFRELTRRVPVLGLVIVVAVVALFAPLADTGAVSREYELFDRGYEYYLAYQPDLAADAFKKFLVEFPGSSAKDAALFWLGKSLLQVRSFDEARNAFSSLRQEFPESPLVPYAERELSTLAGASPSKMTGPAAPAPDVSKGKAAVEPGRVDTERKASQLEEQVARSAEEKKKLEVLLDEEKRKMADVKARAAEQEKRESEKREQEKREQEKRNLLAQREADQRRITAEMEEERRRLEEERKRLEAESRLAEHAPVKESAKEPPRGEAVVAAGAQNAPAVTIGEKNYTMTQVTDSMANSSRTMMKAGIKEVVWRGGNLFDDFVNEEILYAEAMRAGAGADQGTVKELSERFKLDSGETVFLNRYLSISGLLDRKIKEMPSERVVEALTVTYTDTDRIVKVNLAVEMQALARGGKTFEAIAASYPGKVQFSVISFQELQGWIKERIELLRDGEISVVWTRDGYMVLKPVMRKASYRPFEDVGSGAYERVKAFVKTWVEELRKAAGDILILRTQ